MDFQRFVDSLTVMACVISVEVHTDGTPHVYRMVAGNKSYVDSIEHPAPGTEMLKSRFEPNSLYTDYLTRDLNFEDYSYRAAVEKKCLHSYASPDRMSNVWLDMNFIPLIEADGLHYCLYTMQVDLKPDMEKISNISADIAVPVLETCVRLRGTSDFKATMKDVIAGIRDLCGAEHCCILLVNEAERSCSVLGEAFSKDTKLLPMEHYVNDEFYDIA
ncbi:MAG: GGDEF domain-containing protein, partial [Butyrivibrio sp.]|nr:GGDEF domain-containing protein [Butyrivibrio sp.]